MENKDTVTIDDKENEENIEDTLKSITNENMANLYRHAISKENIEKLRKEFISKITGSILLAIKDLCSQGICDMRLELGKLTEKFENEPYVKIGYKFPKKFDMYELTQILYEIIPELKGRGFLAGIQENFYGKFLLIQLCLKRGEGDFSFP